MAPSKDFSDARLWERIWTSLQMSAFRKPTAEVFETPHRRLLKRVLLLTAYVDESNHNEKDFAVVAGFVGDAEEWGKCEADWRAALRPRRHLHMNRLRWANEKRVSGILNRLGPIPHDAGLTAIFSAVRVADYEDLVDGTQMQKVMKG